MREVMRDSTLGEPSHEAQTQKYDTLLDEGLRLVAESLRAEKGKRSGLARELERLFVERVSILRQLHGFPTLDERMPALLAVKRRMEEEVGSWTRGRITNALTFDDDRPAHTKMHEATEARRHLLGIESHTPDLTTAEMDEFKRARRAVLEAIGGRFVFGEGKARYSNLLTFVKDGFVVQLIQDALPAQGLPNAERISEMTILGYVDGQARGHLASYRHGKWDERVKDPRLQRTIDEIAAAVG